MRESYRPCGNREISQEIEGQEEKEKENSQIVAIVRRRDGSQLSILSVVVHAYSTRFTLSFILCDFFDLWRKKNLRCVGRLRDERAKQS